MRYRGDFENDARRKVTENEEIEFKLLIFFSLVGHSLCAILCLTCHCSLHPFILRVKVRNAKKQSATSMPPPTSTTDGHLTISTHTAGTLWKRANRYQHGICCCWRDLGKAYECYMAAANMYNQLNKYDDAAECFFRAGQAAQASRRYYAATEAYVECLFVRSRTDFSPPIDVMESLLSVCDNEVDEDEAPQRHTGRIEKLLAGVLEESGSLRPATVHLEKAFRLFREEGNLEESIQSEINLARLLGIIGEYRRAGDHYRNLGMVQFQGEIRKHHSREYFMRSILCWAASLSREEFIPRMDEGLKRRKMVQESDPTFAETTESKMVILLGDALLAGDVVLFDQFVSEMEANGLMDSWKSRLIPLVRRQQLSANPQVAPPVVATADGDQRTSALGQLPNHEPSQ